MGLRIGEVAIFWLPCRLDAIQIISTGEKPVAPDQKTGLSRTLWPLIEKDGTQSEMGDIPARPPPAERVNKLSVSTDEDELCAIHLRNRLEGRLGDPDAIRRLILAGGEVGRETPVAAKTCLVDPHSIADGGTDARLGDVQSGNRQQPAGLRCRFNSSGGRRISGYTVDRATVRQRKTGRPVRFELTEQTRQAVDDRQLRVGAERARESRHAAKDLGRYNLVRRNALLNPLHERAQEIGSDRRLVDNGSTPAQTLVIEPGVASGS